MCLCVQVVSGRKRHVGGEVRLGWSRAEGGKVGRSVGWGSRQQLAACDLIGFESSHWVEISLWVEGCHWVESSFGWDLPAVTSDHMEPPGRVEEFAHVEGGGSERVHHGVAVVQGSHQLVD